MKTFMLAAAAIAAAFPILSAPAFAEPDPSASPQGHYEWAVPRQFGPRAPVQAPQRVWVPDASHMTSCDCGKHSMTPPAPTAG